MVVVREGVSVKDEGYIIKHNHSIPFIKIVCAHSGADLKIEPSSGGRGHCRAAAGCWRAVEGMWNGREDENEEAPGKQKQK